ncbi:zinc finger CCCH domain-containing protein 42-like [Apium graveolens]|uniref:zinc finger CCCH domain-containing protein 42-like n=1 Tax=Apium graveolens TaxID=4045 RepID=UPI003D78D486
MEGVKGQHFQNQHEGLTFGSLNFSDHLGLDVSTKKNADVLNQEVQNLALKDSIEENGTVQGVLMESEQMEHRRYRYYYPLRPEAENCLFFMRHGWCQFRGNCRYNNPLNRKSQGEKESHQYKINGTNSGWENARPFWPSTVSKKASEPVSQQHPYKQAERSKTSVCPVNDKGLPLRPDMEICIYYSRYGMCKRGPGCRFEHPLPRANPGCVEQDVQAWNM